MTENQTRILTLLKTAGDPVLRTIREMASVLGLAEREVETALLQLAAAKRVRMRREDGKDAWHIRDTPPPPADNSQKPGAKKTARR